MTGKMTHRRSGSSSLEQLAGSRLGRRGFLRAAGTPTLLDRKLLIASLNRGGLAGSAWELDDPMTGATPAV